MDSSIKGVPLFDPRAWDSNRWINWHADCLRLEDNRRLIMLPKDVSLFMVLTGSSLKAIGGEVSLRVFDHSQKSSLKLHSNVSWKFSGMFSHGNLMDKQTLLAPVVEQLIMPNFSDYVFPALVRIWSTSTDRLRLGIDTPAMTKNQFETLQSRTLDPALYTKRFNVF